MGGWGSQLDIVDGCHCWVRHSIFSFVGIVSSCSHLGCFLHVPVLAPACRGVMRWPQAGTGRGCDPLVTTSTRKQSMDGYSLSCAQGSPSSAGLNVTLQNTFTATTGADIGTCAACSCSVPSTRQGVQGSGIIPRMGSMQGAHALAGLIRLRVSPQLPQQTRDKERLAG